MLTITVLLFVSSTALWAMYLAVFFIRQQERMLWNKNLSLNDRIQLSNHTISKFGTPMEALFLFNVRARCLTRLPLSNASPDACRGRYRDLARLGSVGRGQDT